MNLTPEQMQFLANKGLTLAEVIEFASLTPNRSKGAERQARYRARAKAADEPSVTRDVTSDASLSDVTPPLAPSPKEINSNPHPHTPPENKTRARKATRLAEAWAPEPLSGDLATTVAAWAPGALERELARFRDWAASSPNAVKSDWQATWRNWLRKADDDDQNRKPSDARYPPIRQPRPSTRQIGERLAASFAARGGSDPDLVPRLGAPGGHG